MSKFKPQYRRLLFVDRKIREGGYPNCSSLAGEWETSTRTMQRDIDYLRDELEAPIQYDYAHRGFYYEDPSWFLPSVMLSEGDLMALLIGRQALQMYEGTPIAGELQRIYGKLAELLPDKIEVGPEVIQTRFSFFHPPARPIDPEIWRTLLRGLMRQRVLEITYQSPHANQAKPHVIHPYHITNLEGDWYLLAYEERWANLTQLAISRIRKVHLTNRSFRVPPDFDADEVMRKRFGRHLHTGTRKTVRVRLLIEPTLVNYVSEKTWHSRQKLKRRKDGRVELTVPVLNTMDIEPWILSLGEHVSVLEPLELRKQVQARHRAAARK